MLLTLCHRALDAVAHRHEDVFAARHGCEQGWLIDERVTHHFGVPLDEAARDGRSATVAEYRGGREVQGAQ